MWAIVTSLMVMRARLGDWRLMATTATLVLALYGTGWLVVGENSGRTWHRIVPVAAFLIAMGQGWVVTQPMLSWLIFTLAIFGLLALPGAVMIRQAPR